MYSILKQGPHLICAVNSALSDSQWEQLRMALLQRVVRDRSRGIILHVGALEVLDSYACRALRDLCQMARLRGARAVVVGIQPEVAFAMVQLGLRLEVPTALDLEQGLGILEGRHG